MSNSIKYSTTAQTLALKSGNYWIGTGDVGKGPTSTTDYWNGISPPGGGYTVYLNKSSQGPSIYICNSDSDLINLTNRISGENYTTAAQCLSYYVSQVDKMCFNRDYPPIVTDGLVLNLDAGFVPSYPRTGTTWYDNSASNSNSSLSNGPTFNSNGWINFDGSNDYSDFSAPNLTTTASVEMLCKIGTGYSGKMFMGWLFYDIYCANGTIGYNTGNGDVYGISQATVNSLGIVDAWAHYVFEFRSDVPYTNNKIYINGVQQTLSQQLSSEASSNRNFNSGNGRIAVWRGDLNYCMPMDCDKFSVYNRSLSLIEVSQNYYGASIVTDGLVFALDAGNLVSYPTSGTTTYSLAGSFTASLVNGVGYSSNFGGIFDFDGTNDFIELPFDSYWNSNVFGTATNFTLECWYKPDLFKNWDTVIEKSESPGWYSRSEGPAIWTDSGSLQGVFASGVDGNPGGSVLVLSYATTTLKWYHICFTGDGTTLRLYVDGIERASNSVSSRTVEVYNGNVGPRLGRRAFMDGQLGPTRFYTRGLSIGEISQNFNAQRSRFGV